MFTTCNYFSFCVTFKQQLFSVDLDSVYDGRVAPVYELAKVEMDKRNLFQLLVQLYFPGNGVEEEIQQFYSKPFLMRSKPRNKKRKIDEGRVQSLFISGGISLVRQMLPSVASQKLTKPAICNGRVLNRKVRRGRTNPLAQFFLNHFSIPIFPQILVPFPFCACDSRSHWPKSHFPVKRSESQVLHVIYVFMPIPHFTPANSLCCSIITVESRGLVKTHSIVTNNENSPRLIRLCIRKQYVFYQFLV